MNQLFVILCASGIFFTNTFTKPIQQIRSTRNESTTLHETSTHVEDSEEPIQNFGSFSFTFDCSDKAVGFYADQDYNCQIFHMCSEEGKRIPHVCANETSFNQEFRICDWEYNFDCSEAHKWYYLNELTYATEPSDEEEIT